MKRRQFITRLAVLPVMALGGKVCAHSSSHPPLDKPWPFDIREIFVNTDTKWRVLFNGLMAKAVVAASPTTGHDVGVRNGTYRELDGITKKR